MTHKYTLDYVLGLNPCYDETRILSLAAGRSEISYTEVPELPVSPEDLCWLLWRGPDPEITARALELTITRCVTNHAMKYGIPAVELWAWRWLSGEDRSEAAAWAAWAAAGAARAAERSLQIEDFKKALGLVKKLTAK